MTGAALELLGGGEAIEVPIHSAILRAGDGVGAQAHIGFPAVGAAIAVGIGILRIDVLAALDVVVELFAVGEGDGIDGIPEGRNLVANGGGIDHRINPGRAEVKAEGLVDIEVADDARLGRHLCHERLGILPGGHIILAIRPGDKLRVTTQRHARRGGEVVAQEVEAVSLVIVVIRGIDRRREGRIGSRTGRIIRIGHSHRGLEEVVEGGVGLDDGPGKEVIVRVERRVVLPVEVEGIEVGTDFPAVEHPVVIGIAIDGVGADGELFGVHKSIAIRVSRCARGIGVKGRQDIRRRHRLPVVALTEGGIGVRDEAVILIKGEVGLVSGIGIVAGAITAAHREALVGGEVNIPVGGEGVLLGHHAIA